MHITEKVIQYKFFHSKQLFSKYLILIKCMHRNELVLIADDMKEKIKHEHLSYEKLTL